MCFLIGFLYCGAMGGKDFLRNTPFGFPVNLNKVTIREPWLISPQKTFHFNNLFYIPTQILALSNWRQCLLSGPILFRTCQIGRFIFQRQSLDPFYSGKINQLPLITLALVNRLNESFYNYHSMKFCCFMA